ncbi:hypothetical protein HanIR_Chr01g0035321 [Helianthus annuus]|nr:hypothetical protein HanIR_Chr01g0035321 [Helianthus annuus]
MKVDLRSSSCGFERNTHKSHHLIQQLLAPTYLVELIPRISNLFCFYLLLFHFYFLLFQKDHHFFYISRGPSHYMQDLYIHW